jgi:hypothetical protein
MNPIALTFTAFNFDGLEYFRSAVAFVVTTPDELALLLDANTNN